MIFVLFPDMFSISPC